jgi:cytochrome c oxidase subunit IV
MSHAVVSIKTYLVVFLVLMALLSATVAVAYIDLDVWNLPVAMGISIIKGGLIVLFFMHVRYGSNLAKVFAGAGFFWLLILLSLAMSDYATRHWLPVTR